MSDRKHVIVVGVGHSNWRQDEEMPRMQVTGLRSRALREAHAVMRSWRRDVLLYSLSPKPGVIASVTAIRYAPESGERP